MNKKFFIIVALFFVLIFLTGCVKQSLSPNQENVIGGEKDSHGCLAAAGYSWCQAKTKCLRVFEEFCPDEAEALIKKIEENTGIKLSLQGDIQFDWLINSPTKIFTIKLDGLRYALNGIKMAEVNKVEKYLNNVTTSDIYNIADGIMGGLRGFTSGYMACAYNFRHVEIKNIPGQPSVPVGDNLNITLDCGYFNKNDLPKLITEQTIKDLFVQKYNKNAEEVKVTIDQETGDYIRGSVYFSQNGKFGEGAIFLATKINNQWQIVFEGNGNADCSKLKNDYKFPEEILKPNICD